jgi:hypothetical protein
LAGPSEDGATLGGDLDFAPRHAPQIRRPAHSGLTTARVRRKVLAGRNPLLLLRFAGAFLLRLAERRFNGWLLKAPPRKERLWGRRPAEGVFQEQPLPQSIGIGLRGVAHPAHHPAHYLVCGDFVPSVLPLHSAQAAAEAPDVRFRQEPVRGEDAIAEKGNAGANGEDDVLPRVQPQPQAGQ